jgi:hypothetical protein
MDESTKPNLELIAAPSDLPGGPEACAIPRQSQGLAPAIQAGNP